MEGSTRFGRRWVATAARCEPFFALASKAIRDLGVDVVEAKIDV